MSLLLLFACKPEKSEDPAESPLPEIADVVGIANWDDDDLDGVPDWDDDFVDATVDDERVAVALNGETKIALDGAGVRVWDVDEVLLDEPGEVEVDAEAVQIEFLDANLRATLTVGDAEVSLRSAPLILNHHLQDTEWAGAMEYPGTRGNEAFVDGFASQLGFFESFSLSDYELDVWLEDEIELGWMAVPGKRMDVVIDSIRNVRGQGLDDLPEDHMLGVDFGIATWGDRGRATSQDSFGNLEITPPVEVDGVSWPFGRIYYGDWAGNGGPDAQLRDVLAAQQVQAPFVIDVSWLCVGHVDEFMSFVPDPSAPKGWRLYLADTTLGLEFVDGLDPAYEITRFGEDHGYPTVGDLQTDEELRAYNEEVQRDGIDPAVEVLRAEIGLEDTDIVRVPALFEASSYCYGTALALIPGTTNLVVATTEDGARHVFAADPFFRTDPDDLASDLFVAEVEPLFPEGTQVHWVDDWDWYHIAWGEVHCGSNTRRAPNADWWEVATHLMEDE
ncbi:MAG: protein-arginine deiminase family protein [Myxococcota bacterium]